MKRIEYIDIAKGIAILLVVVGHTLCYNLYGFEYAWKQSKLMQLPLSMFLSGFVSVTDESRGVTQGLNGYIVME